MVHEIMQADSFYDFLSDQYGNYVIQKALQVADEQTQKQFLEKLKPDIALLQNSQGFGQKIYIRLVKQYPVLSSPNKHQHTSFISNNDNLSEQESQSKNQNV